MSNLRLLAAAYIGALTLLISGAQQAEADPILGVIDIRPVIGRHDVGNVLGLAYNPDADVLYLAHGSSPMGGFIYTFDIDGNLLNELNFQLVYRPESYPTSLSYDRSSGHLFVFAFGVEEGIGNVVEMSPDGSTIFSEFTVPLGGGGGIVVRGDGIWQSLFGSDIIRHYTREGVFIENVSVAESFPYGLINGDPAGVPGRPLGLQRCGFGAPAASLMHRCVGHQASGWRERHGRPDRGGLERWSVIDQEGFQGLAEVLDEMEPVHNLHGLRHPPANAVGIEVAAIAADHGDGGMLGQSRRDGRGRAVRQQVHDTVIREIHQDGAVPMPPPPRPLIDADGLQGLHRGHRSRPHQAEQGGRTGGEPQASGESGTSVAAESHDDGPEGCDQLTGFSRIRRDQGREMLGENTARTARVPAEELPDRELEMHGVRAPREIRQVALIPAMDGR
jgi:hypothetical protein